MFIAYTHRIPLEKLAPSYAAAIRLAKLGVLPPFQLPTKQKEKA